MKRLVVVVITVSLLVTGLLAGAPAQGATRAGSSPAAGIAWGSCSDPTLAEANAQCGFVEVPLDYRRPGGAKISLAVSRVRHTSPTPTTRASCWSTRAARGWSTPSSASSCPTAPATPTTGSASTRAASAPAGRR